MVGGSLEGDESKLQSSEAGPAHLGHTWGHHRVLEVQEVSGEPGVSAGVRGEESLCGGSDCSECITPVSADR